MNALTEMLNIPEGMSLSDFSQVEILSRSGVYAAGSEERKLLCLLSDGRLLIAQGQETNPHVRSYRARMDRMNRPYRVQLAGIEVIAQAYRDGGSGMPGTVPDSIRQQQAHSMMQITAKDMLTKACQARASDIHIRVRKMGTEIYYRIHNDLTRVSGQTREYGERLLATLYAAMTSVSDSSYKPSERQDASIADRDKLPPGLYGVRIATAPTSEGSVMVLRLLYNDAGDNIDLRPLGFSHTQARQLQILKEQPIGINIISGPTGSGKSTTLQRVLTGEILEAEGKLHVLTVEDPVEYPIAGAVQTAVTNASTEEERSRLFAAAISNAMRLDPDTIMIGEMRDRASAQSALRASMTGHQVWTTVHANSAMAIIDRLADLGLEMNIITDHTVVTGLISQRLVKLLCQECKVPLLSQPQLMSETIMARVRQIAGIDIGNVCVVGSGCEHCKGEGTIGRTVVAEVIIPDARFFEYLRNGEKSAAYQYWLQKLDGRTLLQHAIEKVIDGLIDPRMAEKVVGHLHLGSLSAPSNLSVVEVARAV